MDWPQSYIGYRRSLSQGGRHYIILITGAVIYGQLYIQVFVFHYYTKRGTTCPEEWCRPPCRGVTLSSFGVSPPPTASAPSDHLLVLFLRRRRIKITQARNFFQGILLTVIDQFSPDNLHTDACNNVVTNR